MIRSLRSTRLSRVFAAVCACLTFYTTPSPAADSHYAIETDPATFAFAGYAAHFRISPSPTPHWRFGVGMYAMDLPSAIVDVNAKNKNQGWDVRIDSGYGLFSEYFPDERRSGWLLGTQVSLQNYSLKNQHSDSQKATYQNLLVMPYGGYRWLSSQGFYLQPWLGVGYTQRISGNNSLNGRQYDIAPVLAFATLHVGYEF